MRDLVSRLAATASQLPKPIRVMEVCGTHTMAIRRFGIHNLLPPRIKLISGPGCPVCVTPVSLIDAAVELLSDPANRLAVFGDMVRVPGTKSSLAAARAKHNNLDVLISPFDCVRLSRKYPDKNIIIFAIGFETTLPGIAQTMKIVKQEKIKNIFCLPAGKFVPPALDVLLADPDLGIDAFLCPGHVSVIIGAKPYAIASRDYHRPCVIAGFEAGDILASLLMIVRQIVEGRSETEIQYTRCVTPEGNKTACRVMREVFRPADSLWRGVGMIPDSGTAMTSAYRRYDALNKFGIKVSKQEKTTACRCGDVLKGKIIPPQCRLFGRSCTPAKPHGACMVSSEGTCAAYYKYVRVH